MGVAACCACSDMPAKSSSSAALNGGHHFKLRQVQMACVHAAIIRSIVAEYIRDLQLWAWQSSGTSVWLTSWSAQQVQRARDALDRLRRHFRVDGCALQLGVAKKHLNDPDICAALQKVGRKTVPQSMG